LQCVVHLGACIALRRQQADELARPPVRVAGLPFYERFVVRYRIIVHGCFLAVYLNSNEAVILFSLLDFELDCIASPLCDVFLP
jgi:hypothetical protein